MPSSNLGSGSVCCCRPIRTALAPGLVRRGAIYGLPATRPPGLIRHGTTIGLRRPLARGQYYGQMSPRKAIVFLDPSWLDNEVYLFFQKAIHQHEEGGIVTLICGVVSDFDHGLTVKPKAYPDIEVYIPRAYVDAILWTKNPEELQGQIGFTVRGSK
jgi:hypothetical protein